MSKKIWQNATWLLNKNGAGQQLSLVNGHGIVRLISAVKPFQHHHQSGLVWFPNININRIAVAAYSSSSSSWKDNSATGTADIETHGQPEHRFTSSDKRGLSSALHDVEEEEQSAAVKHHGKHVIEEHKADDEHVDVYNHVPSVNLSSCMQSQVPEPYSRTPTHMNMPGGTSRREDKYIQGRLNDMTGKREYHTSNVLCCTSTSIINNKSNIHQGPPTPPHSVDEHGNPVYTSPMVHKVLETPCPQGVQGDDCAQFKLWLSNCLVHGRPQDCEQMANEYMAGRKTLAQIFADYDMQIRSVQKRKFSTSTRNWEKEEVGKSSGAEHASSSHSSESTAPFSRAAKLKRAVKEYGGTVIVFHIGISLISLGGFYLLVSSNVDMEALLRFLPFNAGESMQKNVQTASTFAAAYAVHKVFAPVRIGITLTCAPIIVRTLRSKGILKVPKAPKK